VISPEEVLRALEGVGLAGEVRTDLHVAEVLVTSARGRRYVIRFLPNGKATVSTPLDFIHHRVCGTLAEVLAAVAGDASV
jgi:hypothetical protein